METITTSELEKLSHRDQVRFALFCANQVIHLTDIKEGKVAIEVTERWLEGKATKEECKTATYAYAAYTANAATYANTATYATYAATLAVNAAKNIEKEIAWQTDLIISYLLGVKNEML